MRALRTLLTLGTVAAGTFAVTAQESFMTPEGYTYTITGGEATLAALTGDAAQASEVTVPSTVSYEGVDYPVVAVGERCMYNNNFVSRVTLGSNVSTVADYAFYQCKNLDSIELDSSLRRIGNMSFYNCSLLKDVTLNEGLEEIGTYAFWQNQSMTSVTIPASVTIVGANPFGLCSRLEAVSVADGNEHFAALDGVLYDKELTHLYTFPTGKYDPVEMYVHYKAPASIKTIGAYAAQGNVWLKGFDMPEGLEEIGRDAFNGTALEEVNIPSSVREIGVEAFLNVRTIRAFTVAEGNERYSSVNGLLLSDGGTILVNGAATGDRVVIPEGVVEVSERAFFSFNNITELAMPSTLRRIGKSAFYKMSKLTTVDFGSGLEEIDDMAFQNCAQLMEVSLPETVRSIGMQSFANCNMLAVLSLNDGLQKIGERAFYYDFNIEEVKVPGTVTDFGDAAFCYTQRVKRIIIGEGVTRIPEGCFIMCLICDSVSLPSTLEVIESDAFSYNQSLRRIDLPEGLRTIDRCAFTTCALTNVTLPSTVEFVGEMAFSNNMGMESFTAGSGLRKLDTSALVNNALTSVTLNEGLEEIGATAFAFCPSLTEIEIPASVTTIGSGVFMDNSAMTVIRNRAMTPQLLSDDIFAEGSDSYETVKLEVPDGCAGAYREAEIWCKFANIDAVLSSIDRVEAAEDGEELRVVEVYDLNGHRVGSIDRTGVYLVKMSDGSVRKVMMTR